MPERPDHATGGPARTAETASTIELLEQVRAGDELARERLAARCLPPLRRWARGRLPAFARGMEDTGDLVQETVMAVLARLNHFTADHEGALQAYLRQALANRITDVVRKRLRRPDNTDVSPDLPAAQPSPLELAVGAEETARYEAALARLSPEDRQAIIVRLELQYSYAQLAVALGKPSPDAARMTVVRAVKRLAAEMNVARVH